MDLLLWRARLKDRNVWNLTFEDRKIWRLMRKLLLEYPSGSPKRATFRR